MMVGVNIFIGVGVKKRKGKFWMKYGPFILTLCAVPLIMADLTRHLLQDLNVWKECDRSDGAIWPVARCFWSSNQYACTLPGPDHCIPDSDENLSHLSPMGILFTICFTYLGFILLILGTMWNANIKQQLKKIGTAWRELRRVDVGDDDIESGKINETTSDSRKPPRHPNV